VIDNLLLTSYYSYGVVELMVRTKWLL